jgi:hypothetical protein
MWRQTDVEILEDCPLSLLANISFHFSLFIVMPASQNQFHKHVLQISNLSGQQEGW